MTRKRFLICGAGALVVWSTVGLSAARGQSAYDSILTGTVFDSSRGVVPAAAITVSGSSLLSGSRVSATESDGTYRFTALPAGFYDVTADLKGFRSVQRTGIRLPPGATIIVDFELVPASITDVVTVEGRSPTVDVKSAASPINIEQEMLHHLPTSRTLPAIINLAPGISAGVSYGGSQHSNELYVEGMRTTGPSHQEPGARFNYNWVEAVQIVALGANAEHGGFTGVGANGRLRSGSNRFSGLGEYWTIRPSWIGRNTELLSERLQRKFAPRRVLAWWDSSAQVGGPIARDRVWFFSGLHYSRHDDTPAGFVGPGSRDERDLQGLVKISAALSPNLRLETFSERGVSRVDGQGIGPGHPIEASNSDKQPQTNWNARLTWTLGPRTLVEMRHGGYVAPYSSEPRPPNTRSGPSPHRDASTGGVSVTTDYYYKTESTIHTTSVTVTRYVNRRFGRGHDLKVG
ncbi:MAG: carboxypeptidase regulatory-like domain-containing protein, partial [Acidobacteria bacterium]|nr:carboxypeptidase regulatory-like domain-containing protein [Acidobacteriota bacterium]